MLPLVWDLKGVAESSTECECRLRRKHESRTKWIRMVAEILNICNPRLLES